MALTDLTVFTQAGHPDTPNSLRKFFSKESRTVRTTGWLSAEPPNGQTTRTAAGRCPGPVGNKKGYSDFLVFKRCEAGI
jgi:hypothetical protein